MTYGTRDDTESGGEHRTNYSFKGAIKHNFRGGVPLGSKPQTNSRQLSLLNTDQIVQLGDPYQLIEPHSSLPF